MIRPLHFVRIGKPIHGVIRFASNILSSRARLAPVKSELGNEIDPVLCARHGRIGSLLPVSSKIISPTVNKATPSADFLQSLATSDTDLIFLDKASGDSARDVILPSQGLSEAQCLEMSYNILRLNHLTQSYAGGGAVDTHTPSLIFNRLYTNSAWLHRSFTETSKMQGLLEALHLYQTFIEDLTGMEMASLGLKDMVTACWVAAMACRAAKRFGKEKRVILYDTSVNMDLVRILKVRLGADGFVMTPVSIEHGIAADRLSSAVTLFVQTPDAEGHIPDFTDVACKARSQDCKIVLITDPLALCVHEDARVLGANLVIGSGQRLGYPIGMADMSATYMAGDKNLVSCSEALRVEKRGTKPQFVLVSRARGEELGPHLAAPIMAMLVNLGFALTYGFTGLQTLASKLFKKTVDVSFLARELGYSVKGEDSWLKTGEHFGIVTIHKRSVKVLDKLYKEIMVHPDIDVKGDWASFNIDESLLDEHTEENNIAGPLRAGAKELCLFTCSSVPLASKPLRPRKPISPSDPRLLHGMEPLRLLEWISSLENADRASRDDASQQTELATRCALTSWPNVNVHPRTPVEHQCGRLLLASNTESFLRGATGFEFVSLHPTTEVFALCDLLQAIKSYQRHNRRGGKGDICCYVNDSPSTPVVLKALQLAKLEPLSIAFSLDPESHRPHLNDILAQQSDRISSIIIPYPRTKGGVDTARAIKAAAKQHGIAVVAYGGDARPFVGTGGMSLLDIDATILNLADILDLPKGLFGDHLGFIAGSSKVLPFLPSPIWSSDFRVRARLMKLSVPGGDPRPTLPYSLLPTQALLHLWAKLLASGRDELRTEHQILRQPQAISMPMISKSLS